MLRFVTLRQFNKLSRHSLPTMFRRTAMNFAILRSILMAAAMLPGLMMFSVPGAFGQAVGGDVGGGAGLFRPKNPETRKRAAKPATPVTKPGTTTRTTARTSRPTVAANDDRVEDLLDKGNELRD